MISCPLTIRQAAVAALGKVFGRWRVQRFGRVVDVAGGTHGQLMGKRVEASSMRVTLCDDEEGGKRGALQSK